MNCCNDYGQCNRNSDCAIRAATKPEWTFPAAKPTKPAKKGRISLGDYFFYFGGFLALVVAICAAAGLTWGLFERFYPSTACMVQMLISSACK